MKLCTGCDTEKEESAFSRNARTKDGLNPRCKACHKAYYDANKERLQENIRRYHKENDKKIKAKQRAYDRNHSEMHFHAQLKRNYGLSPEDYQAMFVEQEGRCYICRQNVKLNVDHDHETGKVRGLLCTACNSALANLKDSLDSLHRAVQYLERSNNERPS